MKVIKNIEEIKQDDLRKINDSLVKFDKFLTNATRTVTDEHIGIYENWIDCMYDIQKLIVAENSN